MAYNRHNIPNDNFSFGDFIERLRPAPSSSFITGGHIGRQNALVDRKMEQGLSNTKVINPDVLQRQSPMMDRPLNVGDSKSSNSIPERKLPTTSANPINFGSEATRRRNVEDAMWKAVNRGYFGENYDSAMLASTRRGNGQTVPSPGGPGQILPTRNLNGVKGLSQPQNMPVRRVATSGEQQPTPYDSILKSATEQYGVPYQIGYNLLNTESRFNPKAVSPSGAQGIAQFMPATAKELGIDPMNPEQAIPGSMRYLKEQYDRFGSWPLALAAYNAGPGNVEKYGGIPPFKETQEYVPKGMAGYTEKNSNNYDTQVDQTGSAPYTMDDLQSMFSPSELNALNRSPELINALANSGLIEDRSTHRSWLAQEGKTETENHYKEFDTGRYDEKGYPIMERRLVGTTTTETPQRDAGESTSGGWWDPITQSLYRTKRGAILGLTDERINKQIDQTNDMEKQRSINENRLAERKMINQNAKESAQIKQKNTQKKESRANRQAGLEYVQEELKRFDEQNYDASPEVRADYENKAWIKYNQIVNDFEKHYDPETKKRYLKDPETGKWYDEKLNPIRQRG